MFILDSVEPIRRFLAGDASWSSYLCLASLSLFTVLHSTGVQLSIAPPVITPGCVRDTSTGSLRQAFDRVRSMPLPTND
jgi:hypothetical protein